MSAIRESFRIAQRCVNSTSTLEVNHAGNREEGSNALAFFREAGCPSAFLSTILTQDGHWNADYQYPGDILAMSLQEIDDQLETAFYPIYSAANGSLDSIYRHGFNKHDAVHIQNVKRRLLYLLELAQAGTIEKKRGLIAAGGHDTGNPWGRRDHSLISPHVVERVFPSLRRDEYAGDWRIIRRAMELHNEPVANWLISSWEKDGVVAEEQIIARMQRDFGTESLALIIADKTDIGRHRISEKPQDAGAVDEDPHLEVNLLGRTTGLSLGQNGEQFQWDMEFTPGLAQEDDHRFSRTKKNGTLVHTEARVSAGTHQLHKDHGISHLDRWKQLFWSLYIDRVYLAVRSTFALYPSAEQFVLRVKDSVDDIGGEEYTERFTKANLRVQIERVRVKHLPKEQRT